MAATTVGKLSLTTHPANIQDAHQFTSGTVSGCHSACSRWPASRPARHVAVVFRFWSNDPARCSAVLTGEGHSRRGEPPLENTVFKQQTFLGG
jgi:hypothetical protein